MRRACLVFVIFALSISSTYAKEITLSCKFCPGPACRDVPVVVDFENSTVTTHNPIGQQRYRAAITPEYIQWGAPGGMLLNLQYVRLNRLTGETVSQLIITGQIVVGKCIEVQRRIGD
jgi:hypothetical protein